MLDQFNNLPQTASEILGDLAAFAEQLGASEGLCQLPVASEALALNRIQTAAAFGTFLKEYTGRVLVAHELPAITKAYRHVSRYEVRELLALDRALEQETDLRGFAGASRAVGRLQLLRLRPLRGERVVQRYLRAVEASEANAWHTLVFGLVLALYSIPLRQGLCHFAQQTLDGFALAAEKRIRLSRADRQRLLAEQSGPIVAAIEELISQQVVQSL